VLPGAVGPVPATRVRKAFIGALALAISGRLGSVTTVLKSNV